MGYVIAFIVFALWIFREWDTAHDIRLRDEDIRHALKRNADLFNDWVKTDVRNRQQARIIAALRSRLAEHERHLPIGEMAERN